MENASKVDALKESLDLLAADGKTDHFADFAIDSDDDDDIDDLDKFTLDDVNIGSGDNDDPLSFLLQEDATRVEKKAPDNIISVANDANVTSNADGVSMNSNRLADAVNFPSMNKTASSDDSRLETISAPASASASNTVRSGISALKKLTVSAMEDPLSPSFTTNKNAGTSTTAVKSNGSFSSSNNSVSTQNHNANGMALPYPNVSHTVQSNPNIPQLPVSRNTYPSDMAMSASQSAAVANLKSKTQSLTSTFSSFASKFSDAVSNAGSSMNVHSMSSVSSNNVTSNSSVSTMGINAKSLGADHTEPLLQTQNTYGNSVQNSGPTVYGTQNMKNSNPNGKSAGEQGQAQEMDKATKSAVLTSAVGNLLPGERVIMFLSNLRNVKETSSAHTGIGSSKLHLQGSNSEEVWCCAMTFYRLIIFSFRKCDFQKDAAESPGIEAGEEIQHWVRSASVSRQFQLANRTQRNGKYHQLIQIPLAAIDRVEKTTEFTPTNNQLSFASSSIIGSSTLYADSLGGSVANGTLVVYGKDNGRYVQFTAPSYADCMGAYQALNTYAFPGRRNLGYLFAFESRREEVTSSNKNSDGEKQTSGNKNAVGRITSRATPRRYDALAEFQRMVNISPDAPCPWRPFMKANATYNSCQSYPSILFGPSSINDETPEGMHLVREIAAFRSGQRFQTLSWASRHDGASLWRCAQPRVGLQGNRNAADEMFIKKIGECAAFANRRAIANGKVPPRPSIGFLKMLTGEINGSDLMLDSFGREGAAAFYEKCLVKIFDLRPKSSAMANRTAGYGYENTSYYKNATLSFHGIGNIHAVRDSYQKISALCSSPTANDVQWLQLVEDTKWLSHVRLILSASWQAAFHVRYNRLPVLLHCSHGWDRTSQVCALAQIFLDPYYRTRVGFSCLVEKDFLALGHPFHLRCGHGEGRGDRNNGNGSTGGQVDEGQMSPIFIQFLDCVFQIVNQYPDYFEFNTKYLLLISEHVYSCRFGTLLCDTEREREVVASIRQRTHCLWEFLDSSPALINDSYRLPKDSADETESSGALLMPLPSLLRNVTLWVERFCMHGAKPTARCFQALGPDCKVRTNNQFDEVANGCEEFREQSLKSAQIDVARWKDIVEKKDLEILELKRRLHLAEN